MAISRSRVPPALEPYIRVPPQHSLTLLTGTLACSPIWLATRFASTILSSSSNDIAGTAEKETALVLVSWSSDLNFWRSEIRRTTGLDLMKHVDSGRCFFLDLLSHLTSPSCPRDKATSNIEPLINNSIAKASNNGSRQVILTLDNPDLLIHLGLATAHELDGLLLRLRSAVHSSILLCSADSPFLAAATPFSESRPTPIEVETAAFVAQQAHLARIVMSVRELDTGAAKDVSGVLRVTRGGDSSDWDLESQEDVIEDMEALYLVQRDGTAKVLERGHAG